jgi:hypothetical protein
MTRGKSTTIVRYTLHCDCGYPIHVQAGQAGLLTPCPSCQRQISVPPLTELRKLPFVECPAPPRRGAARRLQYRLRHLLLLMVFWAIFLALGSYIGFELWAGFILWFLVSFLLSAALIFAVVSWARLLRKGMWAFWDFLEEHRHDGGGEP